MADIKGHLPQIRVDGAAYFVTWRLEHRDDELTPEERTIVANALKFFDGKRYLLAVYVVMDDHVHVVVLPLPGHELDEILHSWKSFTANEINKLRKQTGALWQKSNHTRFLVSKHEVENRMQYVLDNPKRRCPGIKDYPWVEYLHHIT
jgi:REP element-mobilizing transposase RayT